MATDDGVDVTELGEESGSSTELLGGADTDQVRNFVVLGAEGMLFRSAGEGCSVGSHPSNNIVIDDTSVSRFHCELRPDASGVRIRDLRSSNGTLVDGMKVVEAWLRHGSSIRIGRSTIRFELGSTTHRIELAETTHFGSLVGRSHAMRATFALLQRAARSDATVLLEGETGTGKEGAAESIHGASARAEKPFLVVDCGAIPANLLESELFGHERGAFTGANARRAGIFETADGGTVFLDEIGEMPSDLQSRLLRVLERREVRRIGSSTYEPVDVRIVAATNRDLRTEVNVGRFRSDLYFRLAVVRVPLPALRKRLDDIPILVERIVDQLTKEPAVRARLLAPDFLATLARCAWPGNVRELRNYLERCLVLDDAAMPDDVPIASGADALNAPDEVDPSLSFAEARRRALESFERRYLSALLAAHGGKVAAAARSANLDRVYLYKLLHRHGLRFGRG